jgi:two-component system, LytTR family, sensor kinase
MYQAIAYLADQESGSRRAIFPEDLLPVAVAEPKPAYAGTNMQKLIGLAFAFWTIPVIFRLVQSYAAYTLLDIPARWPLAMGFIFVDWYYWAVITPFVFWMEHRFPLEIRKPKSIATYLLAGVPVAAIHALLITAFLRLDTPTASANENFVRIVAMFSDSFLIYVGILAVGFSWNCISRASERETQTADLRNELSQAQLRALQMQLQPHFLFNTLNSISALTHRNPTAANTMIARLSELLRVMLAKEPPQEITLEEELEFLRTYLDIEKVRFDDRLEMEFNIDIQTLKAYIPSLLLQPLIENSIRHGISKRRGSGIIRIKSERVKNDRLLLEIYDNGLGLPSGEDEVTFAEGIGLRNTRHRLQKLYGDRHFFDIVAGTNQRGVRITIIIPFRTDAYGEDQNTDR